MSRSDQITFPRSKVVLLTMWVLSLKIKRGRTTKDYSELDLNGYLLFQGYLQLH